jgi:hypothetical protein
MGGNKIGHENHQRGGAMIWYILAGIALISAVFVGGYVTGAIITAGIRTDEVLDALFHQEGRDDQ